MLTRRMALTLVSIEEYSLLEVLFLCLCTVGELSELFSGGAFSTDDDEEN